MSTFDEVLGDLVAEYDRLETILDGLAPDQWASPSGVAGWTVRDVVVHLAQTEELVASASPTDTWTTRDHALDQAVGARVGTDDASFADVFERWRSARRASVEALRVADPKVALRWAAAPLRPKTLATTRLAEHWAHALDICGPLGIALPDTARLRHIAWLGHATLPYAMRLANLEPVDVHCSLESSQGETWTFGPASASAQISGSVGAFCRVGARRLAAADSGLTVSGSDAAAALEVLRNYAA